MGKVKGKRTARPDTQIIDLHVAVSGEILCSVMLFGRMQVKLCERWYASKRLRLRVQDGATLLWDTKQDQPVGVVFAGSTYDDLKETCRVHEDEWLNEKPRKPRRSRSGG
jgi:hypothetical protein